MSRIHGHHDDDMHYCDNSHRWIPPRGFDPLVWRAQVRAHMQHHLSTMGGAPGRDGHPPSLTVPRQIRRDILFVPTQLGERVGT